MQRPWPPSQSFLAAAGAGDPTRPRRGDPVAQGNTDSSSGPVRSGDAADNPACALFDTSQIEATSGQTIGEINGTTTPGQFAADSHNCFWISADPNGGPWVVAVNLEQSLGSAGDAATESVQGTIDIGADEVPGLGDLAASAPGAVRVVSGDEYLMVQVSSDGGSSNATDEAIALARAALGG